MGNSGFIDLARHRLKKRGIILFDLHIKSPVRTEGLQRPGKFRDTLHRIILLSVPDIDLFQFCKRSSGYFRFHNSLRSTFRMAVMRADNHFVGSEIDITLHTIHIPCRRKFECTQCIFRRINRLTTMGNPCNTHSNNPVV